MTVLTKSSGTVQFLIVVNSVLLRCQPVCGIFSTLSMGETESRPSTMPTPRDALPGRDEPMKISKTHAVTKNPTVPPFPDGMQLALFGMGCFWGAERKFWQQSGVFSTQVGYSAGYTANPTYREVCSGRTGHNEVVRVVFDPRQTTFGQLLKTFWESHNPTQVNKQGNDQGTQYRSGIYYYNAEQKTTAISSRDEYQKHLKNNGYDKISTEILPATEFFYAEDYHQQYLHKNPGGYCGLGGTGVSCPIGTGVKTWADMVEGNQDDKTEL